MRFARLALCVSLTIITPAQISSQQTASSSPQALSLLQRSLGVLSGGQSITDVTLSGTARRIAGSDDDTGPAVFKALVSGAGRADISVPSGQRSELCNLTGTIPAGSWSGPDGVSHAIVLHNLLSEPAWFFPAFAIARRLSTSGYVATYVGHETHEGQAVEHISVSQTPPTQTPAFAPMFTRLTQVDFFLDSTTLLPAAISFNIHPDHDAGRDIPVEIRFRDYRAVSASQVPFHIQKYLNNSLALDFQAQTVTLNSGLPATVFTVEAGCIVPRQKSHLELLKVGLAPLEGRQAVQAQMRPLMVVIPHELLYVMDA